MISVSRLDQTSLLEHGVGTRKTKGRPDRPADKAVRLSGVPIEKGRMKTASLLPVRLTALALAGLFAAETTRSRARAAEADPASAATAAAKTAPEAPLPGTEIPEVIPGTGTPLSEPLRELIRLAERGLGDEVLIAWVRRFPMTFTLSPEEIVYLSDLGISEEVIKVLIEHKGNGATSPTPPPASVVPPINPQVGSITPAPAAPSVAIQAAPEFDAPPTAANQTVYIERPAPIVEYNYFYTSLAPYGAWVEIDGYGRCWRPTVAVVDRSWRPYGHRGRWMYTNSGWYWHSDYSWGWAPFHYGRWSNHPGHGWIWKPDLVWAPAWVTWRWSDSYCGWAPLPPGAHYRHGVGLTYAHSPSLRVGVSFDFGLTTDCYTFIPSWRFRDRHPWRHRLGHREVVNVINQTTIINNITHDDRRVIINEGPGRDRIRAVTRSEIPRVTLRDTPAEPGRPIRSERLLAGGTEMAVYRPVSPERPDPSSDRGNRRDELPRALGPGRNTLNEERPRNNGASLAGPSPASPTRSGVPISRSAVPSIRPQNPASMPAGPEINTGARSDQAGRNEVRRSGDVSRVPAPTAAESRPGLMNPAVTRPMPATVPSTRVERQPAAPVSSQVGSPASPSGTPSITPPLMHQRPSYTVRTPTVAAPAPNQTTPNPTYSIQPAPMPSAPAVNHRRYEIPRAPEAAPTVTPRYAPAGPSPAATPNRTYPSPSAPIQPRTFPNPATSVAPGRDYGNTRSVPTPSAVQTAPRPVQAQPSVAPSPSSGRAPMAAPSVARTPQGSSQSRPGPIGSRNNP